MTMLGAYWPSREEINRCIKSQAEAVTDSVLLSVHQSMPLAVREAGALFETPATEHELLETFLSEDLPEGMLLLPITGASGVGKSHMIRWLASQLERDERGKRMEVIRIPKSANLRTVVELILAPLSVDTRYKEARRNLEKAVMQVTPKDGATRFSAELKIALRNLAEVLKSEVRNELGKSSDRQELKLRLDHANRLPGLFSDAVLNDHFESKVFAPIIERAIRGQDVVLGEEEQLPQFSADDLNVPEHLPLGDASLAVKTYYQTTLNREGGRSREIAASVLNSVIDQAIRQVFQLDQATGGVTLEAIILRIRELLQEDNRELVLLVEDFAALSGIQEVLLKVCIQEAVRDGKQVRAPMRTALALTDGYLASRDTIQTRAKREWVIRSSLEQTTDILDRTVNLVGAYLNSARWGEVKLQQMFQSSPRATEADLTSWIRTFEDPSMSPEEADVLVAFGVSSRGEPLFPYNREAIYRLVNEHLKVSGKLVFNPRRVIDYILRNLLLRRDAFEQSRFPPLSFYNANPTADVASWLSQTAKSEVARERLKSFVFYWGNSPETPEQVAEMPPELFKAFGLPTPKELGQVPIIKRNPKSPTTPSQKDPKDSPTPVEHAAINEWRSKLDQWAGGQELNQQDANRLRKRIGDAVEKSIDWNSLYMARRQLDIFLTIPNARGNDRQAQFKYCFPIADDHADESGTIRRTLLAVICYEESGKNWNYPDGDQGSALFSNMVESLAEHLVKQLADERDKEVVPLVSILMRQGRVLGIVPKRLRRPDDIAKVVVSLPPKIDSSVDSVESDVGKWQALREEAVKLRPELSRQLLDRTGCFQGVGMTPFAMDVVMLQAFETKDDVTTPDYLASDLKSHITKLKRQRLAAITRLLIKRLVAFSKYVSESLGNDVDKNDLVESFKVLLSVVEVAAVWPDGDFGKKRFRKEIEEFRSTPVKDLLDQITPVLVEDVDPAQDAVLDCLGRIEFTVLDRSISFLSRAEEFIKAAELKIQVETRSAQGVNTEVNIQAINKQLSTMLVVLGALSRNGA